MPLAPAPGAGANATHASRSWPPLTDPAAQNPIAVMKSTTPPSPSEPPKSWLTLDRIFLGMLVFVPLAVASHFLFSGTATFILCALALVPLARVMGEATEVVAHKLGSGLGGLMNASFGNAAELIVALAAL